MFITRTELKLYFSGSIVVCAVILSMLSLVAGLLGSSLMYKEKLVPGFTLYVADNDKSVESTMLLQSLKSFRTDTMSVVACSASEAEQAVANGAAAALIIPENFFADIMTGINSDATLIVNRQNEAVAALIKVFAEAVKEQLSAAQSGIYYVLSKASDNDQYEKFKNESNILYLSAFMGREMQSDTISVYGSVSNRDYFTFSFYVFMMFLISVLFIEKGGIIKNDAILPLVLSKSISLRGIVAYKLLSVILSYAVLNVPITGFLALTGVFSGASFARAAALYFVLTVIQASFCSMFIWLFDDIKSAGAVIFVFQLVAQFFSGGLIPLAFLPDAIESLSIFTPNYYLVSLFISAKTDGNMIKSFLIIVLFSGLAVCVSYFSALARKKRCL